MMKVILTDYEYESIEQEAEIIRRFGAELIDLQKENISLIDGVKDADAIMVQYADINSEIIAAMNKCKVIVRYGIGYNNIDVKAAEDKGIYVCNVPNYCLDEVSNHAIALILALSKKLPILAESVSNGQWSYQNAVPLHRFNDATVGLVGFGRIPQMVAAKLLPFGVKIIANDPFIDKEKTKELGVIEVDLDTLFRESDFISLHCPSTPETRNLINKNSLLLMKPSSFLINTARGDIVVESDLVEALQNGIIAGAGLDVFEKEPPDTDNPLLRMNNVIATPHTAWYTVESIKTLRSMVAEEVVNVLKGEKPFSPVNNPNK